MTNPIIERAARALFRDDPQSWEGSVEDGLAQGAWEEYVRSVEIVLRAIREPTGKMCAEVSRREINLRKTENMPMSVDQIWAAMIDAALGDG